MVWFSIDFSIVILVSGELTKNFHPRTCPLNTVQNSPPHLCELHPLVEVFAPRSPCLVDLQGPGVSPHPNGLRSTDVPSFSHVPDPTPKKKWEENNVTCILFQSWESLKNGTIGKLQFLKSKWCQGTKSSSKKLRLDQPTPIESPQKKSLHSWLFVERIHHLWNKTHLDGRIKVPFSSFGPVSRQLPTEWGKVMKESGNELISGIIFQ